MIRFSSPEYLLLLLAALLVWTAMRPAARTLFALRPPHHGPRRAAAGRPPTGGAVGSRPVVIRCAVAGLLVLAASGLQVRAGQSSLAVMLVVDLSDSMAAAHVDVRRRVDSLGTALREGDRAGLVVFGASPVLERPLSAAAAFGAAPATTRVDADVPTMATDIESALRLARTSLPGPGPRRIVLISDGQQTRGDAVREATLAGSNGIPIDVIAAAGTSSSEAVIRHLSAPAAVRAGEPFTLTAVAQGPAGAHGELMIGDDRGGGVRQDLQFSPEGYAEVTQVVRKGEPGVYVYAARVQLADADPLVEPDEPHLGAVVTVTGQPRILYVGTAAQTFESLLSATFPVDSISPPRLPDSAAALASYAAVVLDDVRPDALSATQVSALVDHVENRGAGLLVLGGPNSLDATVQPDRHLGALLPIDLRPRTGVRAPELALVVAFDKSGSMDDRVGGIAKIELARQSVRQVIDALPATDAIGVIAFDSVPTPVAPLRAGHDPRTIADRLRSVEASGSTAIAPAVQLADEWFASTDLARIPRRHVLLVSDGRSSPADAASLEALVERGGFRLSVISLGEDRDRRLLETLAARTGGRAYFPADAQELPLLAAREAVRVAGGRTVEEHFVPQTSAHPIASALPAGPIPPLHGYVVSAAKPGAELVLSSHRDDPVLAAWRYGLGHVAAYTADVHSDWSAQLRASGHLADLVSRTVGWLARSTGEDAFYVRFRDEGDHASVLVDITDTSGRFISLLDSRVSVRRPSGELEHIRLDESRPGRYEGRLARAERGAYVLSFTARNVDGSFDGQILRGFYWSADAERRSRGANHQLLAQVSESSGGRVLPSDGDPFAERPGAYRDVRRWLLAAAFFVFLLELVIPRLARGSVHHRPDTGRHAA